MTHSTAHIEVEYDKLEAAAAAIDDYVTLMKNKMASAQTEVTTLASNWQGADSTQFQTQWDTVTNSESTYTQMVEALQSYAKYLRYVLQKYQGAQSKAISLAGSLPKY